MSDKDDAMETLKRLLSNLRKQLSEGDEPPDSSSDPYAGSVVPKKRGPRDRSAAAVAESDDEPRF